MELDFALLATAAEASGGKLNLLGGGFDTFNVPEVPAKVPPFAIVARFEATDERDWEQEHVASLEIVNPAGETKPVDDSAGIHFQIPPGRKKTRAMVVIHLLTEFKMEGTYQIRLLCNGTLLKSFDLKIEVIPGLGKRSDE